MSRSMAASVRRHRPVLLADRSRAIARLFVPGQESFEHEESRSSPVLERVMDLDEIDVASALADVIARFGPRHRDLLSTFDQHADELTDRLDPLRPLSPARRQLLGAVFTSEYAIEGAALCNPSMVAHPDQTGVPAGGLRFVMSVRGIGEGHRSSIGFRTGTVDGDGTATVDAPGPFVTTGLTGPAPLEAAVFRDELSRLSSHGETADYVLDALGDRFTPAELEVQLRRLHRRRATRQHSAQTIAIMRAIGERTYAVRFPTDATLSERVLWPAMATERQGMEDARFVRFVADDGSVTYYGTYTGYDGDDISQQLLETDDFVSFTSSPVVGQAAANKGLALFPRLVGGRYAALSRSDRETNAIAYSDNPRQWRAAVPCQAPTRPWEVVQLGNCGSPIETEAGWLVLTHGVGPMRTYSIGALLLDLDAPERVVGRLSEPLLGPDPDEQDGYVPNVVYSCGALVHAGTLVLPYGIADAAIGIATVPLRDLVDALA